ncbi:unnamed protein product [Brachionus calyciflorus]|uniref:Uncharacterized protein n=1 Tax=Brachionus calyciflorus TaxID=104777 RepID=A0A813M863_9BILA|nr:unnamed protein product [Brachionus calyciflorus]
MYEQIASDFIEGSDNPNSLNLSKIEEREVFVDNLLSNLLGPEKLKEKGVLADRLKFKRHQIEGSLKTVKKENDKKKVVKYVQIG